MPEIQSDYRLPIQVLVYCFRRSAGGINYLMLRRTPKCGGFWQGVTGAPEGSETLLEGAARELREETQLSPMHLFPVEFSYTFPMQEEWKAYYAPGIAIIEEFVFLAEIADGSEPVLSFEHDLYEWLPYAPAMARLKWPNNVKALEFCNRLLNP